MALAHWADGSGTIAGRDLQEDGTWLGVNEAGRFAMLTNFRDPAGYRPGRPTRGKVVPDLLAGEAPRKMESMNPLNAVRVADGRADFLTNWPNASWQELGRGIHGVSNGPFARPWPKTRQLGSALAEWCDDRAHDTEALFHALRQETPEADGAIIENAPEPEFSPVFIRNPVYGTRCSTIVIIAADGSGRIAERSYDPSGNVTRDVELGFAWPAFKA